MIKQGKPSLNSDTVNEDYFFLPSNKLDSLHPGEMASVIGTKNEQGAMTES